MLLVCGATTAAEAVALSEAPVSETPVLEQPAPAPPAPVQPAPTAAGDRDFDARLSAAEAQLDAAARQLRMLHQERYRTDEKPKKAMLGVLVDERRSDEGVRLTGITPGGGAEAAGLRSRDVLVSVAGIRLDDPDDGRSSMTALTEVMSGVAPGEPVVVGYRRDGTEAQVEILTRAHHKDVGALLDQLDVDVDIDFAKLGDEIAAAAESVAMSALAVAAGALAPNAPPAPAAPGSAVSELSRLKTAGLEQLANFTRSLQVSSSGERFVDLDPDLAGYFGVDAGVLAVSMPTIDGGLRSGDVVLALDGVTVIDAADVSERLRLADAPMSARVRRAGASVDLMLEPDRYGLGKRISVIRIEQDGEDVELVIDAGDDQ